MSRVDEVNSISDDEAVTAHGAEAIYLKPEELLIDERFNMRPYSSKIEDEDKAVESLSLAIEKQGQLDPIIVIPSLPTFSSDHPEQDERYVIIAGHRRRRALALLNSRLEQKHNGTAKRVAAWCVVDRRAGDPVQKAFSSNWDRKNPSPMDVAFKIKELRKEFGDEFAGTKKIGRYLGMNAASVTQYEKLIGPGCSGELQKALHDGTLSMDSVLEVLKAKVQPEKQPEVIKAAREIQKSEAKEKSEKASTPEKAEKALKAGEKARIEKPAVKKAIKRAVPEASLKPSFREFKDLLEGLDGPAYGNQDGAVREWVRYTIDKYLEGEGTETTWVKKFDAMVEKAPKGTRSEAAGSKSTKTVGKKSKNKK